MATQRSTLLIRCASSGSRCGRCSRRRLTVCCLRICLLPILAAVRSRLGCSPDLLKLPRWLCWWNHEKKALGCAESSATSRSVAAVALLPLERSDGGRRSAMFAERRSRSTALFDVRSLPAILQLSFVNPRRTVPLADHLQSSRLLVLADAEDGLRLATQESQWWCLCDSGLLRVESCVTDESVAVAAVGSNRVDRGRVRLGIGGCSVSPAVGVIAWLASGRERPSDQGHAAEESGSCGPRLLSLTVPA